MCPEKWEEYIYYIYIYLSLLTGRVHVMPAGLRLCLGLRLSHHGGAERFHHSWLTGPRGGLGNESRRPGGGAWAARVKGRGAAMETSPIVSSAPNTAVTQVHWQCLLWKKRWVRCNRKKRDELLSWCHRSQIINYHEELAVLQIALRVNTFVQNVQMPFLIARNCQIQ